VAADSDTPTSVTLLGRLRDLADKQAWPEFVARYGPRIYDWCRAWQLQEADADDVTQDVLCKLAQMMPKFRYEKDGSFRGYLHQVTFHALCDFWERRQRAGQGSADGQIEAALAKIEAREELAKRLEDQFDLELLELAEKRVRPLVRPTTWEAYRLRAQEGKSPAEVAAQLGIPVGTATVHFGRVVERLREEIARLERRHGL
jgi:RNA polymerase sigma-70 factor (ECF subfamily)